jgi:hypothetical protein
VLEDLATLVCTSLVSCTEHPGPHEYLTLNITIAHVGHDIAGMPATLEKPFQASRPPCAFRSHPDDFPSTYEQQVNENLRHFAKAAESRQEFYPLENGMPRRKTFNRRRCQIIICVVLVLVALATILAAIGTSTGFLSGTGASQVSVSSMSVSCLLKVKP